MLKNLIFEEKKLIEKLEKLEKMIDIGQCWNVKSIYCDIDNDENKLNHYVDFDKVDFFIKEILC